MRILDRYLAGAVVGLVDRDVSSHPSFRLKLEAIGYGFMVPVFFVSSGTRRMWPLRNVGSSTDDYSLTADQQNVWLTGGTEGDVITEAHLDQDSIFAGVQRFARERPQRLARQRALLDALA